MSTTTSVATTEASATVVDEKASTDGIVTTVLELGFAWAAYGLKIATGAVEGAVRILGVTAKQLDQLADDFAAKSGAAVKQAETK